MGRAGRVREGVCFRLYSREDLMYFRDRSAPEIQRTPLEQTCLILRATNRVSKCSTFLQTVMDAPSEQGAAVSECIALGAMHPGGAEEVTALGRLLSRMPVTPRLGKMLLHGLVWGCLPPLLSLAAQQQARDPFMMSGGQRADAQDQDRGATRKYALHHQTLENIAAIRGLLERALPHSSSIIAKERSFPSQWLVYQEKGEWAGTAGMGGSNMVCLRGITMVTPAGLALFGGALTANTSKTLLWVGDDISFSTSAQVCDLIARLRGTVDLIIARRIAKPSEPCSQAERAVLAAATTLLRERFQCK
eukprot:gene28681-15480_t